MKTTAKLGALMAILRDKPDLAKQILADAASVQKAAEASGLEFKEVEEMISSPTASQEEPPAEETSTTETPAVSTPAADPDPSPTQPAAQEEPIAPVGEKAAAPQAEAEPPEDEIGGMTHQQLADFVAAIVKQVVSKKEALPDLSSLEEQVKSITEAIGILPSLKDQITENQNALLELIDARPIGIKQMQGRRPTEQSGNVVATQSKGPGFDEGFLKLISGGK